MERSVARAREAQRQQMLLAALQSAAIEPASTALTQTGARAARGFAAYRENAALLSERALGAAFPTLRTMVGAGDFAHLAREFRHAHPPACGDLGEWGDRFADWLEARPALAEWPYLGDCARLDFALHRCERASDGVFDAGSLAALQEVAPERLRLILMPGTAALRSRWPIGSMHAAHRRAAPDFAAVRAALAAGRGECVLVARSGWRGVAYSIDAVTCAWTQRLLDGADLASALDAAAAEFDFAEWLATALRNSWLLGVTCAAD